MADGSSNNQEVEASSTPLCRRKVVRGHPELAHVSPIGSSECLLLGQGSHMEDKLIDHIPQFLAHGFLMGRLWATHGLIVSSHELPVGQVADIRW